MRRLVPLFAIAVILRAAFVVYKVLWGFDQVDFNVCNPDEIGYLERAQSGLFTQHFGYHWLYEWLTAGVLALTGSVRSTYALMCIGNCLLSLALPLIAIPTLRVLTKDLHERVSAFVLLCGILWLAPSSIWLAGANLKDMTLASLYLVIIGCSARISQFPHPLSFRGGLFFATIVICISAIFCLRVYMAAVLLFGVVALCGTNWKPGISATVSILVLLGGAVLIGGAQLDSSLRIESFAFWDEAVLEATNQQQLRSGQDLVFVNRGPMSALRGCLFHLFAPLPNFRAPEIGILAVSLQTGLILCFIVPLSRCLFTMWRNPFAARLILLSACFVVIYGVLPSIAGPRQRFSTSDVALALVLAVGLTRKNGGIRVHGAELAFGMGLAFTALAYTSRGSFSF